MPYKCSLKYLARKQLKLLSSGKNLRALTRIGRLKPTKKEKEICTIFEQELKLNKDLGGEIEWNTILFT